MHDANDLFLKYRYLEIWEFVKLWLIYPILWARRGILLNARLVRYGTVQHKLHAASFKQTKWFTVRHPAVSHHINPRIYTLSFRNQHPALEIWCATLLPIFPVMISRRSEGGHRPCDTPNWSSWRGDSSSIVPHWAAGSERVRPGRLSRYSSDILFWL